MSDSIFSKPVAIMAVAGTAIFGMAQSNVSQANSSKVINLTQVGCQFVESENGTDHGYSPAKKADCVEINGKTAEKRLGAAKTLELKSGDYTFRVVNKNVPYELGFWLRSVGYDWRNPVHKLTKTSVSGGGLVQGMTKDYKVTLKPGEYVYSCPLNTTLGLQADRQITGAVAASEPLSDILSRRHPISAARLPISSSMSAAPFRRPATAECGVSRALG